MASDDLSDLPTIFYWMHGLSAIVLPFNILSMYIIATQSPRQMRTYSRYLLFSQMASTLIDFSLMFITTPWLTLPAPGGMGGGLLTWFGVPAPAQLIYGITVILLFLISMLELFYQRHQSVLPAGHILKLKRTCSIALWHSSLCMSPVVCFFMLIVFVSDNKCDKERLVKKYPMVSGMINREAYYCFSDDKMWKGLVAVGTVLGGVCSLMFVKMFSTVYHLYCIPAFVSKKTREMQKRMFVALIIQVVVPVGFLIMPMFVGIYICANDRVDLIGWNPYLTFAVFLHGPCTTLTIMFIYAPYLQYLKRLCKSLRTCDFTSPKASVQPTRVSIQKMSKSGIN